MIRASKPVAIITGVSGGIGQATAKLFAARGWIVVGTVRGRGRAGALTGSQIDLQLADMLKPRDLEKLVKTAWRTYGRLDALVLNAGYGLLGAIDSVDFAQINEQFMVNTLAPAELIRLSLPLMRVQKSGVIIGVSSIVGRTGLPGYGIYSASKFAMEGLLESLALELKPGGIRVKLIEPSSVSTSFWSALRMGSAKSTDGKRTGKEPSGAVTGRQLTAEKVASTILHAATDQSTRLRYPLGYTRWLVTARSVLPERLYLRLVRRLMASNF
jgi:NAD(P)-dependent dehydrogenase (short-subunit alcohol dehydrogenase family)